MDKVSIIIPFYNCQYVNEAIESALNQNYSNIEIIVVDDGSTKYVNKVKKYVNRIKYIKKPNGGTASALNTGIKNASGDYIMWLSSDDVFQPSKISKQLFFMKEKNASICYSPYILVNERTVPVSGKVDGQFYFRDHKEFYRNLQKNCFVNGSTIVIRKDVFSKVGLFNEKIRYAHDYDYWLRAAQLYQFYYLDEPLVLYRIHEKMTTKKKRVPLIKEFAQVKRKHRNTALKRREPFL
ncbi:glycosyltransferase [Halalkalibacter lacteus]|uniref:glycosyltransferase n=1 Tax=Halalkalibacter lacteus TaxID=3090663 RepID=UPI002FC9E2C2